MANRHRRNVLVTSCLKTPVDPNTKAPLASYERGRAPPCSASGRMDNRDYEKEMEYENSESEFCEEDCEEDCVAKAGPHMGNSYRRGHPDLSEIFFSNKEYYSKLEELKKAHLTTMAKLENVYGQKLQLRHTEPIDRTTLEAWHRKQDLQRNKEYKQEIREMCERVKGRPLLLEQVAQRNAKQAAEKRYIEALHGSDVTEDFISTKAGQSLPDRKTSVSSDSKLSNQEDVDHKPVHYRKVFLDDEDIDDPAESKGRKEEESDEASLNQDDQDHSTDDYHGDGPNYSDESYSEDDENYSDNSEHETDVREQEVGK